MCLYDALKKDVPLKIKSSLKVVFWRFCYPIRVKVGFSFNNQPLTNIHWLIGVF
jgi:hypothetical protein